MYKSAHLFNVSIFFNGVLTSFDNTPKIPRRFTIALNPGIVSDIAVGSDNVTEFIIFRNFFTED